MNYPDFFNSKSTSRLFGLKNHFEFLSSIYLKQKFPKVLLLSGNKGSGKSTLINHLLFSIFDKRNYNFGDLSFDDSSSFFTQFKKDLFYNILYLKGAEFQSVKIEDIRNLKNIIFKTSILNKDRFIILDDIELFNNNSLNALLKLIEEPSNNNYFILIYNKSKSLLDTIKSRSLEIKIILNRKEETKIIRDLIDFYDQEIIINPDECKLSPGKFIKFNYITKENKILLTDELTKNISLLLNLYKKNKDIIFIDMIFFITDFYFENLRKKNILSNDRIYELKNFIFESLNKYFVYNINQNSLINVINNRLIYE